MDSRLDHFEGQGLTQDTGDEYLASSRQGFFGLYAVGCCLSIGACYPVRVELVLGIMGYML